MRKALILINIFLLIALCSPKAQQYEFEHFDALDKEDIEAVRCFFEDREGFIWIGTNNGLFKYEGNNLIKYFHVPGDTTSLPSNSILGINEDAFSTLWICTTSGLSAYNKKTNHFNNYFHSATDSLSLSDNWVKGALVGRDSTFLIATRNGLNKVIYGDEGKIKFHRFFPKRNDTLSTSEWSIESMIEDKEGKIWIGTWGGGILEFDRKQGRFFQYLPPYKKTNINDYSIVEFEEKNDSILWAASYNSIIYTFNIHTKKYIDNAEKAPLFKTLKKDNISIYSLKLDSDGKLWIGASQKLIVYDPDQDKVLHDGTPVNPMIPDKIKDQAQSVYEDKQGLIWVGYGIHGCDIYDNRFKKLNHWYYHLNSPNRYRDYITSMTRDKEGFYWMSTWGDGLIKTTENGRILKRIKLSEQLVENNADIIKDFEFDIRGFLWLGTQVGIIKIDPVNGKILKIIKSDPENEHSIKDNSIHFLYPDNNGMIWVATQESLRLLDPVKDDLRKIDFIEENDINKVFQIYKTSQDNYLIVGERGLYYHETDNNQTFLFQADPLNPNSLRSNQITSILEDSKKQIWIGTDNGINLFSPGKKSFKNFPDIDGNEMANKRIRDITEDKNGNIWILTSKNLILFNPQEKALNIYSERDGLSKFAHNLGTDDFGDLQMADEKGFYRIPTDSLQQNNIISPIYLTQFYLSGEPADIDDSPLNGISIGYQKKIIINYTQNDFGFAFSLLNYRHPERNQYQYIMEGYNDDWVFIGNKSEVSFMNMPSGKYTFKVKGANNDNIWNEEPAVIKVVILPPPWRSWWAYTIYGFIIGILIYLYRRIMIMREQEKAKAMLDKMKLSFFIDISHELRTPLTLITDPLSHLINKMEAKPVAEKLNLVYRNASRLQHLVNQLLDIRKMDVGRIKPVVYFLDFIEFIENITVSFKSYAAENNYRFSVNSKVQDPKMWFDPDMLEKVLSNLVINAFKYTPPQGSITINLHELDRNNTLKMISETKKNMHQVRTNKESKPEGERFMLMEITDEGKGLNPDDIEKIFERFYQKNTGNGKASVSSGIGLSLVKEIMSLLHGYIFVRSTPGKGTTFQLIFPVDKEAYKEDMVRDKNEEINISPSDYSHLLEKTSDLPSTEIKKGKNLESGNLKPVVLVVEDNTELLEYLSEKLLSSYDVITATDGQAGYNIAINQQIDLIISDIMMPELDGISLCKKIKNNIDTSHIPVILLTARQSIEHQKEGLSTGADDYISKPFSTEILLLRVENILENRKKMWNKIASDTELIPEGLNLVSEDENFLKRCIKIVEENISESNFDQELFSQKIGLSRSTVYRKIKSLTNQSVNEFIRNVRLKKAAEILRSGKPVHIAGLAYTVGFSESSYFTTKFRELFGVTPKVYNRKYLKSSTPLKESDEE